MANCLVEKSRKHKSKKNKRDQDESDEYDGPNNFDADETPSPLNENGGNTREMESIQSEVIEQLETVKMNPFLQAIVANSNNIDLAKDLKNQ